MTPRQCEIAAESYSACLLSQAGYDVLVQYGANQPHYDLVAEKDNRFLPISVKDSQDGGWMLAVRYKKDSSTYHEAIDKWLAAQRDDIVFLFVQFIHVSLGGAPRAYLVKPPDHEELLNKLESAGKRKMEHEERIRTAEARHLTRRTGDL